MYKISVPVMNKYVKRSGREQILNELRRFNAERVFLALGSYELDPVKREREFNELKDNCRFFKEQGFEVGAWLWTFWLKGNGDFKCMRSINGTDIEEFMCPSDIGFVEFAREYIRDVAKCGIDMIMLDDDFRYGFLSDSPGCLCDNHINEINRITGKSYSLEEIHAFIVSGGKNEIRDAYLQANGSFFRAFAKELRQAVDSVSPSVRLGACACMTGWDIDGTDARELAYLLAGNTRPFVRLIGAPYWAVNKGWGNTLADVIELERMESAWTDDGKIEIMAEGDTFPRPRSECPAAYLEGFDTAIRASCCTSGILKYGIDYYANADYETGYAKMHERNREVYKDIDALFGGGKSVGVRVYESMKKVGDMVIPTKVNKSVNIENLFFSKAARMLTHCSIPTVYSGEGVCGVVFDENARSLPLSALDGGLILDIAAAEFLAERGIDIGIDEIGHAFEGKFEHFLADNNHILANGTKAYEIKLSENAEALSYIESEDRQATFSYKYENKQGQRFFVLNVNTREGNDSILKNYARSKQLEKIIPWLGKKPLPAHTHNHPDLYIQCKKKEGKMAVGLWNFSPDFAFSPVIQLDKEYSNIKGINCNATISKKNVTLTDILPYGFAFFEVE